MTTPQFRDEYDVGFDAGRKSVHDACVDAWKADYYKAAFAAGAASRDSEVDALRADAAKWRAHVKPKIVGWMNPCNGVVIDTYKKQSVGVGNGYPNFSVPVFAAIAAEGGKT